MTYKNNIIFNFGGFEYLNDLDTSNIYIEIYVDKEDTILYSGIYKSVYVETTGIINVDNLYIKIFSFNNEDIEILKIDSRWEENKNEHIDGNFGSFAEGPRQDREGPGSSGAGGGDPRPADSGRGLAARHEHHRREVQEQRSFRSRSSGCRTRHERRHG